VADDRLARLTERQRQLLILVADNKSSSKLLAQETGLTPASIDTILQGAAKILEVRGREDAARRYAELVEQNSQTASQLRSSSFPDAAKSAPLTSARADRRIAGMGSKFIGFLYSGVPLGGKTRDYGWRQILFEIFRVALLGLTALFALVLIVLGFFKTFA